MGTRSRIGVEHPDGSITSIYCHWNGYPEHNGQVLVDNFSDYEKIQQLMNLGDLSSLGSELGEKQDFDNPDRKKNWCLAYGRDRGETDVEARTHSTVEDFLGFSEEYNYLYRDGEWLVQCNYYSDDFFTVRSVLEDGFPGSEEKMNYETPKLAVDCIVSVPDGIVLIKRKYPPLGCAIPGGFVDVGETLEQAAIREMKEELNLNVRITGMLGIYDDPNRDPRQHVISVVFMGQADGNPVAGDDAKEIVLWNERTNDYFGLYDQFKLPEMAFDHKKILKDFIKRYSEQYFGRSK